MPSFSGPANGAVGGSVVFAPDNPPSTTLNIVQWQFGTTLILIAQSDSTTIVPEYSDRVSFDRNTLALELWDLRLDDSGIYRLTVVTSAGETLTGETSLQVFGECFMKDNSPLSPSNSIIFSSDNRSVSNEVDLGFYVLLSCSANSEPAASFSWKFNGTDTNVTIDTFIVDETDFTHSGDYICTALNTVTKRNTSQKHALLVTVGESSANISSVGTGSITSVQWMKDNSPLSPSNSIIFSSDNRSVSISPVQRSDSGEYQCTYRNPAISETATLSLIINYGPEDVSIKGEDVVDLGVRVSLSCSANSEPAASFSWKINETDTDVTTDTFTIDYTDFTHSGDYICTAWNNVTKRSATQQHTLLVKGKNRGGLSSGAIAGIVIGVLVAVAGICGLTVYLIKAKKM
uniref:Ig-like domain-containing protein n=1 Tax=Sinocyclocheilus grahami TaxID=75366 RepID=A0A672JYC9_SINGR